MKDTKTRTAMRDAERDRQRYKLPDAEKRVVSNREEILGLLTYPLTTDKVPVPRQRLRKVARAKRA